MNDALEQRPQAAAEPPATKKQAPPRKKAPQKKTRSEQPGQSASISAGQRLVELKLPAPLAGIAQKLAKGGTFTGPQLAKLRDGINTHAESLREKGQKSLASRLSAANRLVRRLERAARKGR